MEEKEDTKHCQQGQSKEEKPNKQDDSNQTEKVIPMLEAKQLVENMIEERHENESEVKVENHAMEEGKVGDSQTDSSKKLKQGSKHYLKAKVTIPQPFSLATEKRMSREKQVSMDLKDSKGTLARTASLNYKFSAQSSLGAERSSELRRAYSTSVGKTSMRPKVSTNEHADKTIENHLKTKDKVQVKEVERKKQVDAKKPEGDELDRTKFQKSSTFKALPLPSFYHRKDCISAPVSKKMLATYPKSPLISQQNKPLLKKGKNKAEDTDKRVLKKVSSSTKETLSKLLKTTRKTLSTPKDMVKSVAPSAG